VEFVGEFIGRNEENGGLEREVLADVGEGECSLSPLTHHKYIYTLNYYTPNPCIDLCIA